MHVEKWMSFAFMNFFSLFGGNRKTNEQLALAISENNVQLHGLTEALIDRVSPEKIREAILSGLQSGNLENCLSVASKNLDLLNSTLKGTGTRPLPVQTFPITDDFQFEDEKQKVSLYSSKLIQGIGKEFVEKLKFAHRPVGQAIERVFSEVNDHKSNPEAKNMHLDMAMKELLDASPKRIIAAFQKFSLEAGWLIVSNYNALVDLLAKEYPRCRAGIYSSRLNYSDVIQISEEILATLRATATMLEDVQRRHDLLDALKGELLSDLHNSEIQKIWDAIGASFSDTLEIVGEDDRCPWYHRIWKGPIAAVAAQTAWAIAVVSSPAAQFQGQLARAQRIRVFVATAILLRVSWLEWSKMNQTIVVPNLEIMFALKADYARNRMIAILDLITVNGYTIKGLNLKLESQTKTVTA